MSGNPVGDRRGVAPVIAVAILVALAVVLATTVSAYVLTQEDVPPPAPQISVSHALVDDGGEQTIAVTLEGGDAVDTDQLYVTGSKPLDVGGAPGSGQAANEGSASSRETFVEASGDNPPQVGIGEQWESGETIYLDPEGDADGVTVSIYWNTEPVAGADPGTVTGDDAYLIAEFRV